MQCMYATDIVRVVLQFRLCSVFLCSVKNCILYFFHFYDFATFIQAVLVEDYL